MSETTVKTGHPKGLWYYSEPKCGSDLGII
jgi:hypothetical protein